VASDRDRLIPLVKKRGGGRTGKEGGRFLEPLLTASDHFMLKDFDIHRTLSGSPQEEEMNA